MQIARTFWFMLALGSLGAIVLVFAKAPVGEGRMFILVEFALFAIAFMATVLSGRVGWALGIGVGLGFLFATVLAIGVSSSCSEGNIICFSPGEVFVLGLFVAGALYPGWALGVGVGNLVRGLSVSESNR